MVRGWESVAVQDVRQHLGTSAVNLLSPLLRIVCVNNIIKRHVHTSTCQCARVADRYPERCGFRGSPWFMRDAAGRGAEYDTGHIAMTYVALATLRALGDDFRCEGAAWPAWLCVCVGPDRSWIYSCACVQPCSPGSHHQDPLSTAAGGWEVGHPRMPP
jgi:hypothetical protein